MFSLDMFRLPGADRLEELETWVFSPSAFTILGDRRNRQQEMGRMGEGQIGPELHQRIRDAARGFLEEAEVSRIAEAARQYIETNYMPLEKVTALIVAGRLEELSLLHPVLQDLCDEDSFGDLTASDALLRILEHVGDRRRSIKSIAGRQSD